MVTKLNKEVCKKCVNEWVEQETKAKPESGDLTWDEMNDKLWKKELCFVHMSQKTVRKCWIQVICLKSTKRQQMQV